MRIAIFFSFFIACAGASSEPRTPGHQGDCPGACRTMERLNCNYDEFCLSDCEVIEGGRNEGTPYQTLGTGSECIAAANSREDLKACDMECE